MFRHRPLASLSALALLGALSLSATAQQPAQQKPSAPPVQQPPAAPPPAQPQVQPQAAAKIVPVAYEDAVISAANDLLQKAKLPPGEGKLQIVIDPLIDGQTGAQSAATRRIEQRIKALVKQYYPRFEIVPFTAEQVAKKPLLLVGTFTAVNTEQKSDGPRDAYRLCLALADLGTGNKISGGRSFMTLRGVDAGPTPSFRDSPVWIRDPATEGLVRTCQATAVGQAINAQYMERIGAAALVASAMAAYDARQYKQALELYKKALTAPGGTDQLRVHNGLYLANLRLNKKAEAAEAFGKIIDLGLKQEKLAVMYLFNSGSAALSEGRGAKAQPYAMWTRKIAERATAAKACLEVVGHTSRSGPDPINLRLSTARAEQVRTRLIAAAKGTPLAERLIATGAGARETIVGTMPDGPGNALDRRVEFKVIKCA